MGPFLKRYSTEATVQFVLYTADGKALQPSATIASGDVKIVKDGGAAANTTNLPVNEGNGIYSLTLTVSEMTADTITVILDDATATETFLGTALLIETFGEGSVSASNIGLDLSSTIPADLEKIDGSTSYVSSLSQQLALVAAATGNAVTNAGNTTTSFITDLTLATDDILNYRVLKFTSGSLSLVGKYVYIRDYDGTTKTVTTTDCGVIPTSTDGFIIV